MGGREAMAGKLVLLTTLALLACPVQAMDFSMVGYDPDSFDSDGQIFNLFLSWLAKHSRMYHGIKEKEHRFQVFKDNLRYIHAHNRKTSTYRLGLNKFADLTLEEFETQYLGKRLNNTGRLAHLKSNGGFRYAHMLNVPSSIDWREKGAVSDVMDQGSCGSCWAFSTTGSVEGINKIVTGKLVSLSEQELVDCDQKENEGCDGGFMDYAFQFIIENGGIDTEQDYPYKGVDGLCDEGRRNSHVVAIDGYEDVPYNDEISLQKAVANQPVSLAIEAGGRDLQLYQEGVFSGTCGTNLNHAVLAVGYGTDDDGTKYWIVKNSWGPYWGEKGFIRMERIGSKRKEGLCGINIEPSYAIKDGPNPSTVCGISHSCPESSTCCCGLGIGKLCLSWGCCPLQSATCCDDHSHCCPSEYPVCNLKAGQCLKRGGDSSGVELLDRTPADFHWPTGFNTDQLPRKATF